MAYGTVSLLSYCLGDTLPATSCNAQTAAIIMASPLELERSELGYSLVEIREERTLRVIHKPCPKSDVCVFFVHGGGGRAGQFKHLIRKLDGA